MWASVLGEGNKTNSELNNDLSALGTPTMLCHIICLASADTNVTQTFLIYLTGTFKLVHLCLKPNTTSCVWMRLEGLIKTVDMWWTEDENGLATLVCVHHSACSWGQPFTDECRHTDGRAVCPLGDNMVVSLRLSAHWQQVNLFPSIPYSHKRLVFSSFTFTDLPATPAVFTLNTVVIVSFCHSGPL